VHIGDADVRDRLIEVEYWLNIAKGSDGFGSRTLTEVVLEGRRECVRILGAWLRAEASLLTPTAGWRAVQEEAPSAIEAYRQLLREHGVKAEVPRRLER
jgi:hypothetical protein